MSEREGAGEGLGPDAYLLQRRELGEVQGGPRLLSDEPVSVCGEPRCLRGVWRESEPRGRGCEGEA